VFVSHVTQEPIHAADPHIFNNNNNSSSDEDPADEDMHHEAAAPDQQQQQHNNENLHQILKDLLKGQQANYDRIYQVWEEMQHQHHLMLDKQEESYLAGLERQVTLQNQALIRQEIVRHN